MTKTLVCKDGGHHAPSVRNRRKFRRNDCTKRVIATNSQAELSKVSCPSERERGLHTVVRLVAKEGGKNVVTHNVPPYDQCSDYAHAVTGRSYRLAERRDEHDHQLQSVWPSGVCDQRGTGDKQICIPKGKLTCPFPTKHVSQPPEDELTDKHATRRCDLDSQLGVRAQLAGREVPASICRGSKCVVTWSVCILYRDANEEYAHLAVIRIDILGWWPRSRSRKYHT